MLFFFAELPKDRGGFYVKPELGALFEEFTEFERYFGRDGVFYRGIFIRRFQILTD